MRLGHRVGEAQLARRHPRQVALPLLVRAVGPDHPRRDEVRVQNAGEGHPAARQLDLDQHVGEQVEPEAAVLLRDGHAEQAHPLHVLDQRLGVLVGVLVVGGDRVDLALDPLADGGDDRLPIVRTLIGPPRRLCERSAPRPTWRARLPAVAGVRKYLGKGLAGETGRFPAGASRRRATLMRDRMAAEPEHGAQVVAVLEVEHRLLERLERPARERGVLAELLSHLLGRHRVLGRAQLVGEVGLERLAVAQRDPHAARGTRPGTRRTPSSRSAPSGRGRARARRPAPPACTWPGRRGRARASPRSSTGARTCPRSRCAARPSTRPARARARRPPRAR